MTREDIDHLWHQALHESVVAGEQFTRYHFAALVAAAEREACAKLVDDCLHIEDLADQIRARGNHE